MAQQNSKKKTKNQIQWKSSPYKRTKEEAAVFTVLLLSAFLYGGFYEFSGAMLAAVLGILLIVCRVKYSFQIKGKKQLAVLLSVFLWFGITCFYAIDRAMDFVGVIKMLPLPLGYLFFMQFSDETRQKATGYIAHIGCFMVLAGILALPFPALKEQLWQVGRLGGFFQYSNTCALYLLAGLVVICNRWIENKSREQESGIKRDKMQTLEGIVLLAGLLLTGSRGVMLLFFGYLIWFIRHLSSQKAKKYGIFCIVAVFALLAVVMVVTNGAGEQNIGRIFTVFRYSSTWKGRILYDLDALKMIAKYPFGMGYHGYAYVQGRMQTGVYKTLFVHNDWLQAALDLGILPAVLFAAVMLRQLLKGSQSSMQKQILLLIMLHMLIDFDLQFTAIGLLGLLCLDYGKAEGSLKKKTKIEDCIFLTVISVGCIYFCMPFLLDYVGEHQKALSFYGAYTPAQLAVMEGSRSAEEATSAAEQILTHNTHLAEVYQYLAYGALEKENYEESFINMEKAISCDIYAKELYDEYEEILSQAEKVQGSDQSERRAWIRNKKQEVLKKSSSLAYELNERPQL